MSQWRLLLAKSLDDDQEEHRLWYVSGRSQSVRTRSKLVTRDASLHCKLLQPSGLSTSTMCWSCLRSTQLVMRWFRPMTIARDLSNLWFSRLICRSRPVVSLAGTRAPISCQLVQLFHAFQTGQLRKPIPLRTNQSCQPDSKVGSVGHCELYLAFYSARFPLSCAFCLCA